MTPRWITIEKLVAELGGVRRSQQTAHADAEAEHLSEHSMNAAVALAADAVRSAVKEEEEADDDSVVRDAWHAIASAQDAIARLHETIARSRALRERAQRLQDESLRLRQRTAAAGHLGRRETQGG